MADAFKNFRLEFAFDFFTINSIVFLLVELRSLLAVVDDSD